MPKWTRREVLKAGLIASATAGIANGAVPSLSPDESSRGDSTADSTDASLPDLLHHAAQHPADASSLRERLLLDFGWRFHLGNADDPAKDFGFGAMQDVATFAKSGELAKVAGLKFDDSSWRSIDLPHDWAVELPFVDAPHLPPHGAKPLGRDYPETSIGWYRRTFDLPSEDSGKRISVEFDGIFRNAMIVFNGFYVGTNFSGYAPCRFDLTDFANYGGKNVLTVRVDATFGAGWFYEGAGIYRHAWLTKTSPLHVAHWGVFVQSEVRGAQAAISAEVEVENESDAAATCRVKASILDPNGKIVAEMASEKADVAAWKRHTFAAKASIDRPLLWSLEERNLYRLVATVEVNGQGSDRVETPFGIRTVRFDADKGFFLNGAPVKLQGTCNHQDHAGVGSALPDRLQYYRVERLKEMGCNAYRTSHNPPTPELLDACDRLGMLVMDETRMMSSDPEGLSELDRLIRRDRNHPSVVIWSIGNEEPSQGTPRGARIAATMKRLARKLDPTRPITMAMNWGWGEGVSSVVDVQGFNYAGQGGNGGVNMGKNIDDFHAKFPQQPTVGTESGSDYSTRGIYANDKAKGYVSAYDVNHPGYTTTLEGCWKVFAERAFLAGSFGWTGFDYRGEPSPYGWPCVSSHFGAMDTCGFPKDNYFYYQSVWLAKPMLHLFPHWNWEGKEGQPIQVWCYTNLQSVELFLNGKSLGSQSVEKYSHVQWSVNYAPGVLEARASTNGKVVVIAKRETSGAPKRITFHPDRPAISADGEDVSVVAVEIVGQNGRVVPIAMNEVTFQLSGPGRLIGVGNGDPSCHEADKPASFTQAKRSAFNGLCMVFVQSLKQPGAIQVSASSPGLETATTTIHANPAKLRPAIL
ncbi:MAG TPA: beta-galactosidase GalA [Candidatus Acidoferrales bacterium]|nr:beta-galactosidase GalA [Candidatus Acidoferrales bacterium]